MSFIINIDKQSDIELLIRINTRNIVLDTKWHKGKEYCYDTTSYRDYCIVKQLQINLENEGYTNVPCV